ncbi:MAG TPA: amidohydrolase family protein, partial [Chloroflexota bacterium]
HQVAALGLIRARGSDGVAVVTDGLPAMGLSPGRYEWMGRAVTTDGTAARLEDGGLAGSATPMLQALRNLVGWGVRLEDAARMCSRSGAILSSAGDRKGEIAAGFDADLVLLDRELNLAAVYCGGVEAFASRSFSSP